MTRKQVYRQSEAAIGRPPVSNKTAAQNPPRGVYKSPAEWYTGSRSPGAATHFACADHGGYRAHKQPHQAAAAGSHVPAGLAVIQGRTTGGDWLKEQELKRSVEEKTNEMHPQQDAFEYKSDQNERLSDKEKSQRSKNVSKQVKGYSFDLDGNIVLNRQERDAESVGNSIKYNEKGM